MAGDREDRTQAATPRRLQRARDEGNVPLSREVTSLAGVGAATLLLMLTGPSLGQAFLARLRALLTQPSSPDIAAALASSVRAGALLAGPIALVVLAAAAFAVMLQTRFHLKTTALVPDIARLDPRRGLKRLFGLGGLVETLKSVSKVVILGVAIWQALRHAGPSLPSSPLWQPELLVGRIVQEMEHLLFMMIGAQAAIAFADYGWMRCRHASDLRMSREDVRQESRESDGDSKVKGRLRQMRMARAKKRMLAAVPGATVVITNPTHFAVALAYDRGRQAAPRVVAKGVDEVAARIRQAAEASGVPLYADPPLARALFNVELDAEIPLEHFKAVAEIIAYVWRLRRHAKSMSSAETR